MFFICEGIPASPMPEAAERLRGELHRQHVRFVAEGVEKGLVVFGGPKPEGGGVMLIKAPAPDACRAFLDGDPLVRAGAQNYRVTAFRIVEHNACIDPLLEDG